MGQGKNNSKGFTLIASLLILVLLSGVAAGLLFMVTNEVRMSGNDQEDNLAYYGAESGMEKLASDMADLYQQYMVPTTAQIQTLVNNPPPSSLVPGMTYTETICFPTSTGCVATNNATAPPSTWNTVSAGSNQGLYAEIVPMTLQVIASRPEGASVNITRKVEVALIPVFQFGVFCGYDCSYFPGPNFSFGGRVHTNMNLFLAAGGDLVFNDKVQAYKQIVMDQLENGHSTTSGYGGTVYIAKATGGCPLNVFPPTGSNCVTLPGSGTVPGDASWSGGYPSIAGAANSNFASISNGTFNTYLANSITGVSNLQLPFVQNSCVSNPPPCTDPISIIRKPLVGESPTGTLGSERLYNKAAIRILIADDPADLHPERGVAPMDAQDVQFPNTTTFNSPTAGQPFQSGYVPLSSGVNEYVGWGTPGANGWVNPYTDTGLQNWTATGFPLIGEVTTNPASVAAETGPWIRVEYCRTPPCNTAAAFVGVTQEWLKLGFSRIFNNPPTTPGSNAIDPNAILLLQQLRPGVAQAAASAHGAGTQNNFYPINFYDVREGEMRDNTVNNTTSGNNTYSSCSVNGIMNAVELDVGNLARWLNGTIGASGTNVNYSAENGYVLYFSDHRGMLKDPHPTNGGQTPANVYSGESGIEDVINSSQGLTTIPPVTDGVLEPASYYSYSPEDVDQNGFLDNWGEKNLGYGFGINTNTTPLNPYKRINVTGAGTAASVDCASYNTSTGALLTGVTDQEGMANPVSGARHVLKLVDGGMSAAGVSYLPIMPAASGCVQNAASPTGCGGFTIASENPVYVQGNYNSSSNDPFWGTANNVTPSQANHSAASIIADSVTLLSNTWSDMGSLMFPDVPANRAPAADAYYRMAVSGGKNVPFGSPGWANTAGINDFGTDGGLHNFLRYLENWGNVTLHYDGSLVSMYYSEYDTGTFKCCTTVYSPPTRNYYFDVLFLNPNNLPPATPEFQDVVNLSYRQNFTPQ
ncbi:MAG TPA: PilX N-terminal domain-containing pilus assembly protein [Candidatus Sulfotelmatobacter sp.]|nr:PilX N-terminal domain-containing pilus assembly protein [Candidatus Sulfotelmatobacter sp.]